MESKKGIQILLDWLPISKIKLPIVAYKATVKKKIRKKFSSRPKERIHIGIVVNTTQSSEPQR